jgi:hypothetical protein
MTKILARIAYPSPVKFGAILAGLILTLASAALNVSYALSRSNDATLATVWGAVAVASAIALALAVPALMRAIAEGRPAAIVLGALAVMIFGSFNFAGALGAATSTRLDAASMSQDLSGRRLRAKAEYEEAIAELGRIAPTRSVGELEPLIVTLLATPGANACAERNGPISREVCSKVDVLKAEIGRDRQRRTSEKRAAIAKKDLDGIGAEKPTNSDALALSRVASALGFNLSTDTASLALVVLTVLLVEIGGGLCFGLAACWPKPNTRVANQVPAVSAGVLQQFPAFASAKIEQTAPDRARPRAKSSTSERLREVVAQRGHITAGQRGLAKLIGTNVADINRAIKALSVAGVLVAAVGKSGTTLTLAA